MIYHAFPRNPNVGQVVVTPTGLGYEWTSEGAWRVVEIPSITQIDRDSIITSPRIGRRIFNLTTERVEEWNGFYWAIVGVPKTPSGIFPEGFSSNEAIALEVDFFTVGGVPPYIYSVVAGSLPSGLSLARAGKLWGIPGTSGQYRFTIRSNDAAGGFVERSFSGFVASA